MHYTVMTDMVQHFQFHEANAYTIRQALQAVQKRLELVMEFYQPDHVLILSDHGLGLVSEDDVDKDGKRNGLTPIKSPIGGYILTEGVEFKGAFVGGEHQPQGVYVLHGPKVDTGKSPTIKNHYLYGAICEIFDIPLPDNYKTYPIKLIKE